MKTFLLTALAAGLLAGGGDAPADAKKDKEKLQGTWKVVGLQKHGQAREEKGEQFLVIAGDEFMLKSGENVMAKGTFKLDPSKKPLQIDLVITEDRKEENQGKTVLAIYALEGDQLKLCLAEPGERERPTEFSAEAGTARVFVTLKRAKSN
jgi:uncharacterized protein (TIGR03067 family)